VVRRLAHEPLGWRPNNAALAEGRRVLIGDQHRFDGVQVVGVDTVLVDLTAIRDGTGPARLLDMVEGRSKAAFKTWLTGRDQAWRDGVQVVAMDRFTGFKTAAAEELPTAVAVMDPFHVVRLAGDALDRCRRRVQATRSRSGRKSKNTLCGRITTMHLRGRHRSRPSASAWDPC
jgi:transposase